MAENERKPIVKFAVNMPAKLLTFKYDEGKLIAAHDGVTKDGKAFKAQDSFMHGVTVNGVESVLFASKKLNDQILALKPKDKVISIAKTQGEEDKWASWVVSVVGEVAPQSVTPVTPVVKVVEPTKPVENKRKF